MYFISIVWITLDSQQKRRLNQDHVGSFQLSLEVFTKPLEVDTQRKQCCPRAFTSVVERYCLCFSLFMLYLSAIINLCCIFDSLHKVYVRKSFDGRVDGSRTRVGLDGKPNCLWVLQKLLEGILCLDQGKGKARPRTGQEGPQVNKSIALLFL